MAQGHLVRRAADARFVAPSWAGGAAASTGSGGFGRWSIVDEDGPAVHTGFGVCELAPGASVPAHVHSYEESVFVLSGEVVARTAEGDRRLGPGDYGLVPVGVPHEWHNPGTEPVRWADMLAPQPRSRHGEDTLLVPALSGGDPGGAPPVDPRDPRQRRYGHIAPGRMDKGRQSQELLAVSASMRTALLVYSGITVKMMVDSDLGADLTTMFMVQYDPDGMAGRHDHPFEETYLFIE